MLVKDQNIGDQTITVGGGSSFGTSEHIIERLNQYNCNAGIVTIDQKFLNLDGMNLKLKSKC